MKTAAFIPPSRRLDRWAPIRSSFRDTIVMRSTEPPDRLMEAFEEVTLDEIPLVRHLGRLHDLFPTLHADVVLERTHDELVVGRIGKLHRIHDQERFRVESPAQFEEFRAPGYEKMVMSFRTVRVVAGTLLVLEHRTLPLDERARRRFSRGWPVFRRAGEFVTRRLLAAVSTHAGRPPEAAWIRARTPLAHF